MANNRTSVPPPLMFPQFLRKSDVASPPAVVRILTTQKRAMTSGTLAATGAGKIRPSTGTVPLERRLGLDGRSNDVVCSGESSTDWVISSQGHHARSARHT